MKLDKLATYGLAAFAGARLVALDSIAREPMNAVLGRLVSWEPSFEQHVKNVTRWLRVETGEPVDSDATMVEVRKLASEHARSPKFDLRAEINAGETKPLGDSKPREYIAEMLTCGGCASFHLSWIALLATGRFKPHKAHWWVELFAIWAIASQLTRMDHNKGGSTAFAPDFTKLEKALGAEGPF